MYVLGRASLSISAAAGLLAKISVNTPSDVMIVVRSSTVPKKSLSFWAEVTSIVFPGERQEEKGKIPVKESAGVSMEERISKLFGKTEYEPFSDETVTEYVMIFLFSLPLKRPMGLCTGD